MMDLKGLLKTVFRDKIYPIVLSDIVRVVRYVDRAKEDEFIDLMKEAIENKTTFKKFLRTFKKRRKLKGD